MAELDFARYLTAKRGVDDRALHRRVWERLCFELRECRELRVADIGAGTGIGAERMRDWKLFPESSQVLYTAIEPRPDLAGEARKRLATLGFDTECREMTLAELASRGELFDLVVAHALVDLLDLPSSLDALVGLARPGGLLYLPICFDGDTIFEPAHPDDDAVVEAFHGTMKNPTSGRRLFHALRARAVDVLEIGASDWIVRPIGRTYPEGEEWFLRSILAMVRDSVSGRLAEEVLEDWLSARTRQIERAELVYIAHQLDLLGRKETAPPCT